MHIFFCAYDKNKFLEEGFLAFALTAAYSVPAYIRCSFSIYWINEWMNENLSGFHIFFPETVVPLCYFSWIRSPNPSYCGDWIYSENIRIKLNKTFNFSEFLELS